MCEICGDCSFFAVNPYNSKVGACMDSANDGFYSQVKADQPKCSACSNPSHILNSFERKLRCPVCGRYVEVGDFIMRFDGSPSICMECRRDLKCTKK